MSGPSNAVVGDLDQPTDLPVTNVPDEMLEEERKLAKYSRTAEYKRLKEYMEGRIRFFQTYLPDGSAISARNDADDSVIAAHWRAANIVIAEFQNVLNQYEQAKEVVDNVGRQNS